MASLYPFAANPPDMPQYMYLDQKRFSAIGREVFAENLTVDYMSHFGGGPFQISGSEQAQKWDQQTEHMDAWQHIITGLLIELPQPGEEVQVPEKTSVVANVLVMMQRKMARGDGLIRDGGRLVVESVRTKNQGNPWRINHLKVDVVWFSGNHDVLQRPL